MVKRRQTGPASTEEQNPRSRGLDVKSTAEILRTLNREDARVPAAVGREIPAIARAVDAIVRSLQRGGRLFYIGAGTSGRLAVLDASECPPTFGVPRTMIQAIIAGGQRALTHAAEGAEDATRQGARDLAATRVMAKDVVVGVSASGSTPYVLGALRYARQRGAFTVGVAANRGAPMARLASVMIAPDVGPEAIAGSTRMKAGTAQKLVLNMLSTATMVRLGHVYDNWMINVALSNQKLRRRGLRILEEATGANLPAAEHALRQSGNNLRVALVMLKSGIAAGEARRRLTDSGGNVRKALEAAGRAKQRPVRRPRR